MLVLLAAIAGMSSALECNCMQDNINFSNDEKCNSGTCNIEDNQCQSNRSHAVCVTVYSDSNRQNVVGMGCYCSVDDYTVK